MIRVHLTEEERRAVEQVSRQAVGRVALRAHMVLLAGRGYRVPRIAAIHACGEDVVRHWLHRYQDLGVAGVEDAPRSGRRATDLRAGRFGGSTARQSTEG